MTRSLKVEMEQQDDGSFEAWFREQPSLRVHATTLDELLRRLNERVQTFTADGGDPTTLAVEDSEDIG